MPQFMALSSYLLRGLNGFRVEGFEGFRVEGFKGSRVEGFKGLNPLYRFFFVLLQFDSGMAAGV